MDIEISVGLIVGASSLYSYFHKTPWPKDFNLILVCMVVYHIATYGWLLVRKIFNIDFTKWINTSFEHDSSVSAPVDDELSRFVSKNKSLLANSLLKFGSKADLYSELYTVSIEVVTGQKKVMKVDECDAVQEQCVVRDDDRYERPRVQGESERVRQKVHLGGHQKH